MKLFPNIAVLKSLSMKKIFLIIGFLVFGIRVSAQGYDMSLPDSLSLQLRQAQGQNRQRAEALAIVCDYYFNAEQFADAQPFVNEIRELDGLLSDNVVTVIYHYYQGSLNLGENKLEAAMQHLLAAENGASMLRESGTNLRFRIRTLISLGVCYFKCQLIPDAFQCFQQGLELNEKLKDNELNAMLKTDISQVYLSMNDIRKALEINKELLIDDNITPQRKCSPCISVGNLYIDLHEYDSAQIYLDIAESYACSMQDKFWIMMLKAKILRQTSNYDQAIALQQACLDSLAKYPNPELEVPLLISTARCHYLKGSYNAAMEYTDKAITVMEANPAFLFDVDAFKLKSNILEKQMRYQEALDWMKAYGRINDSIMEENNLGHLYELELQRNIKEVEENARLEQFAIEAKYKHRMLISIIILISLVTIIIIVLMLLKRKNILLQNKQMKEELLSKELDQRNRELAAKALANAAEGKPLEDFDYYFVQTHPDFYNRLRADYPNLTPYELRLCSYLRLNLSTKDIATLNNISLDSARVARHRLRKTLGITDREESLVQFLSKY